MRLEMTQWARKINIRERVGYFFKGWLAVGGVLMMLIIANLVLFFLVPGRVNRSVQQVEEKTKLLKAAGDAVFEKNKKMAAGLIEKNPFFPPPPIEFRGVLGDSALINNKWYKAGDSFLDGKIVEVQARAVVITRNNQTQTLYTIPDMLSR